METENKLLALMTNQFGGLKDIRLDSDLIEIGYDSLKFIALVVKVEAAMGIEFDDECLSYHQFKKVQDVAEYLNRKRAERRTKQL